jgi:hypothetical protein
VISILYQKKNVKNIIFVTIIFGGLNVFMPITSIQIPNNLSLAQKNYKKKKQNQGHNKKQNHKECKPKFNPRLEIQRCKAKTWYMF